MASQAAVTELATRIAELQTIVSTQQAEIQSLRAQQQQQDQQQQAQQQVPVRTVQIMPDTKLGQPPAFVGDESAFDNWSFKRNRTSGTSRPQHSTT